MGGYDYTRTERTRRRRARLKAERLEAEKAARAIKRVALDAARIARGLPPAKSSTERARETRARQAKAREVVRTESWYSPPFTNYLEARQYLTAARPGVAALAIEALLDSVREGCERYELHFNKFTVTRGIEAARIKRAVLHQVLETRFCGDCTYLGAAMKEADQQINIQLGADHPNAQYQERQRLLDIAQIMFREGGFLNNAAA
jgi:hypothetical protein